MHDQLASAARCALAVLGAVLDAEGAAVGAWGGVADGAGHGPAHEGSVALPTLSGAGRLEAFGDPVIAAAIIDRLVHCAEVVSLNGRRR
jgi:hypothetical protein